LHPSASNITRGLVRAAARARRARCERMMCALLASNFKWYPVSGIWLSRSFGSLRAFARGQSGKFYKRLSAILFDRSADSLRETLAPYVNGQEQSVRFDYEPLPIGRLMNLEQLGTTI